MMEITQSSIPMGISKIYTNQHFFFPLINNVIERKQKGKAFKIQSKKGVSYFVIHQCGNSQFLDFGNTLNPAQKLEVLFSIIKDFKINKIRVYNCDLIDSVNKSIPYGIQQGERFRYHLPNEIHISEQSTKKVTEDNIWDIEQVLKIDHSNRFWSNHHSFMENSFAVVFSKNQEVLSICYSAATSSGKAEIDILTNPKYRKMGFAKKALLGFVIYVRSYGISPQWDCYANNISSVKTAESIGFRKLFSYKFFIISSL